MLRNVIEERRIRNKITIIANNTHKYFFKLADSILVLGKAGQTEIGSYDKLSLDKESLFNRLFLRHHEKVNYNEKIQ